MMPACGLCGGVWCCGDDGRGVRRRVGQARWRAAAAAAAAPAAATGGPASLERVDQPQRRHPVPDRRFVVDEAGAGQPDRELPDLHDPAARPAAVCPTSTSPSCRRTWARATARSPGCDATGGKNGIFQYTARGTCTATEPAGRRDVHLRTSAASRNYTGNLADVFTCIAALGETGCGFEHQFAAILRALGADGSAPPAENQGFLRPDAYLAIVMLTNEDDCSRAGRACRCSTPAANTNLASQLGPAGELPLQRVRPPVRRRRGHLRAPEPHRAQQRRDRDGHVPELHARTTRKAIC